MMRAFALVFAILVCTAGCKQSQPVAVRACACTVDFDGTSVVDLGDLSLQLSCYGYTEGSDAGPAGGASCARYDLDCDGDVDGADVDTLNAVYGLGVADVVPPTCPRCCE